MENIDRQSVTQAARDAVENLIYTVVFDTCNKFISNGAAQDVALQCGSETINEYVENGVKIRKKPAPRTKAKPKADKPTSVIDAASRKLNSLTGNLVWIRHPQSDEYSYTTGIKLKNGFPVRNNATGKIVMTVGNSSTEKLTIDDIKIGRSFGLDMDYESTA